jgi:hypothetical protein
MPVLFATAISWVPARLLGRFVQSSTLNDAVWSTSDCFQITWSIAQGQRLSNCPQQSPVLPCMNSMKSRCIALLRGIGLRPGSYDLTKLRETCHAGAAYSN